MYPEVQLYIDGKWTRAGAGRFLDVMNPATGEPIGKVAHADRSDLDRALEAADKGFKAWRKVSAFDRSKVMRKAANLLRERADAIAPLLTMEQGKPLAEAKGEAGGRRRDRLVRRGGTPHLWPRYSCPGRRRLSARGQGAGRTGRRVHAVELPDQPGGAQALLRARRRLLDHRQGAGGNAGLAGRTDPRFADAGVPAGVVNLVYGVPAEISEYLIPHPVIRKISFTGSTAVGKQLAALAGAHMKRVTMELGGHAPAIVFDDADIDAAAKLLAGAKFRNAGQVCVSPTRLPGAGARLRPVRRQVRRSTPRPCKVGDGLERRHHDGPAGQRAPHHGDGERSSATRVKKGAKVAHRRQPHRQQGQLLRADGADRRAAGRAGDERGAVRAARDHRAVRARSTRWSTEANRLPYGLAAYAYTRSAKTAHAIAAAVESGMMSINHHGLALPEVPFGGVKDSGYGSEGGLEAIETYLNTKFVTQAGL